MVAARRRRLIADAPPLLVLSAGLLLGAALLNPLLSSSREARATVSAPPPLQAWIDATATGGTLTDLPLASRRNYALTIGFVRKIANSARAAPAYTARLLALALSGKDRPMASRILAC